MRTINSLTVTLIYSAILHVFGGLLLLLYSHQSLHILPQSEYYVTVDEIVSSANLKNNNQFSHRKSALLKSDLEHKANEINKDTVSKIQIDSVDSLNANIESFDQSLSKDDGKNLNPDINRDDLEGQNSTSLNFNDNSINQGNDPKSIYIKELIFILKQSFQYPSIAKKMGHQGRVILKFIIDKQGRLIDVTLIEKTSYSTLNSYSFKLIKQVQFQPIPTEFNLDKWEFILPINFKI